MYADLSVGISLNIAFPIALTTEPSPSVSYRYYNVRTFLNSPPLISPQAAGLLSSPPSVPRKRREADIKGPISNFPRLRRENGKACENCPNDCIQSMVKHVVIGNTSKVLKTFEVFSPAKLIWSCYI